MFLGEKVVLSRIATREIALVEKPGSTHSLGMSLQSQAKSKREITEKPVSSGKKLSPPFCHWESLPARNLLAKASWALSHRRMEPGGRDTGGSTWYVAQSITEKHLQSQLQPCTKGRDFIHAELG